MSTLLHGSTDHVLLPSMQRANIPRKKTIFDAENLTRVTHRAEFKNKNQRLYKNLHSATGVPLGKVPQTIQMKISLFMFLLKSTRITLINPMDKNPSLAKESKLFIVEPW